MTDRAKLIKELRYPPMKRVDLGRDQQGGPYFSTVPDIDACLNKMQTAAAQIEADGRQSEDYQRVLQAQQIEIERLKAQLAARKDSLDYMYEPAPDHGGAVPTEVHQPAISFEIRQRSPGERRAYAEGYMAGVRWCKQRLEAEMEFTTTFAAIIADAESKA